MNSVIWQRVYSNDRYHSILHYQVDEQTEYLCLSLSMHQEIVQRFIIHYKKINYNIFKWNHALQRNVKLD